MISGSVARRYARALLSIARDSNSQDALSTEIDSLAKAFEGSADLRALLSNPIFTGAQRLSVLEELLRRLGLSPVAQNAARLLLQRGRMNSLPAIARSLRLLTDESAGRVRARVTSAQPIDAETEARLRSAIARVTGKSVVLEKHLDSELLAGIVTQVGDVVYDGSLAAQLAELRQHWAN